MFRAMRRSGCSAGAPALPSNPTATQFAASLPQRDLRTGSGSSTYTTVHVRDRERHWAVEVCPESVLACSNVDEFAFASASSARPCLVGKVQRLRQELAASLTQAFRGNPKLVQRAAATRLPAHGVAGASSTASRLRVLPGSRRPPCASHVVRVPRRRLYR